MGRRYQVVTYSHDTGADDRMDYTRKAEAMKAARRYRDSEEYAAVYDRQTNCAVVVFGDPFARVFRERIKIIAGKGAHYELS